jgi:hypothetical protein
MPDEVAVALCIYGADLDPEEISSLLGAQPTHAHRLTTITGLPRTVPKTGPTMNTDQKSIHRARWIGLADVCPHRGNELLGKARGAFVAVVGEAVDPDAFFKLVERQMAGLCFDVRSLEDVELLDFRLARNTLPAEMIAAIADLSDRSPIAYGSFHAYS